MSKAFTKDDDGADGSVGELVPPRAPLPAGVPNYVTARGLAALRAELGELTGELARARATEASEPPTLRARTLAVLAERIAALEGRIGSAELVTGSERPPDEVRFGAHVTLENANGAVHSYRIVGVDEANASAGRIAFVAPLARALLGKRVGDTAIVQTPHGEEELELLALDYAPGD